MKLNINSFEELKKAGIEVPSYDVVATRERTLKDPIWIHFGAGNIFRGFIARLQDDLLNQGLANKGVIACETFDGEIINKIYNKYENLTLVATLSANEPSKYRVVASVAKGMVANPNYPEDFASLKQAFINPSLQMISFTITEKGYALTDINKNYLPVVEEDFKNGPSKCFHAMSLITSLLYERYTHGGYPIAVVSMDNCSHNGEKLMASIVTVAKKWIENNLVEKGFLEYLEDESKVSFPWSMIDKITPRPAKEIEDSLEKLGFDDMKPVMTSRHTFIAPFVNTEVCEYLVIEDKFPNGRPCLEKAGVYLTDRETVNKVETMKVTTCLNPLHTALAVYGCLLGYKSIASEMEDSDLVSMVKNIGSEGMKVVVDPKIISPQKFLDEVLYQRLPNKSIPDTPQRIATDTSQKVPVRYGETIKSYLASKDLSVDDLHFIPLAIAGWLRYLLGLDDNLEAMELSSDPMLDVLTKKLANVKSSLKYNGELKDILSNSVIFGTDLTKTSLASKVKTYFEGMLVKSGVRKVLSETVKKYAK